MTTGRDTLSKDETVTTATVEGGVPALIDARTPIERLHTKTRRKFETDLLPWIELGAASLVASSAHRVARDVSAIRTTILTTWSNRQTEGQVTKLEPVKRRMSSCGKSTSFEPAWSAHDDLSPPNLHQSAGWMLTSARKRGISIVGIPAAEVAAVGVVMMGKLNGDPRADAHLISTSDLRPSASVLPISRTFPVGNGASPADRPSGVIMPILALPLLMAEAPTDVDTAAASPHPMLPASPDNGRVEREWPVVQSSASASPPRSSIMAEPSTSQPTSPAPDQTDGQRDIVVTARTHTPGDPLQSVNAQSFAVTQTVDKAVIGPAALAYQSHVPEPVRSGVHNFLNNLHEPDVSLNYLLQLKPGKAMETIGRFAINLTIGAAGLFDVAKRRPFRLPRRPNGFGDTLGYYGVKSGPFFFLPVIGPATLRDLAGGAMDRLLLPLTVGKPFNQPAYTLPTGILSGLDRRAEFDGALRTIREGTSDPYTARRDLYLRRRQAEIDHLHERRAKASPVSQALGPPSRLVPKEIPSSSPGDRP